MTETGCIGKLSSYSWPLNCRASAFTIGDQGSQLVRQVGENDRPIHAPTITGSEVLWNPFEDIVPRTTREERMAEAAAARCASWGQNMHMFRVWGLKSGHWMQDCV